MEKGIEIVRRTLVFCLWICGVGISLFFFLIAIVGLLDMVGLFDSDIEWWMVILSVFLGIVAFGLTFLLHVMINWIFQVDE